MRMRMTRSGLSAAAETPKADGIPLRRSIISDHLKPLRRNIPKRFFPDKKHETVRVSRARCDTMGAMKNIRVLLWDIDNTLLDFLAAEKAAIRQGFSEFGLGECTDGMLADYSSINRRYWEKLERGEITKKQVLEGRFAEFFGKYALNADVPAFNDRYQILLGDTICFMDDGYEIVRSLKGKILQGAVTNGTRTAQEKRLKNSGLGELFDLIFISEDIGVEKPGKGFFDAVLKESGRLLGEMPDPREMMIVGDSLTSDMLGGVQNGLVTCWYNPGGMENKDHLPLDHEIRNLHEVPAILGFVPA